MHTPAAHVLLFPSPLQGHLNCMLHFATGLVATGVHVTFVHTDHSLRRLGVDPGAATPPRLRFLSVPDGLPDDHPRSVHPFLELMVSMRTTGGAAYRALLSSLRARGVADRRASGAASATDGFPPVTCVVADGILPFAIDIAEELGVPAIAFRTASACSFLTYLSVPKLLEHGELPFPEGGDLDEPVRGVPGMASSLRRRDLPIQFRNYTKTHQDPVIQLVAADTAHSRKARALVLNTAMSMGAVGSRADRATHARRVRHRASPRHVAGSIRGGIEPVARGRRLHGVARRAGGPVRRVPEPGEPGHGLRRPAHGVPVRPRRRRLSLPLGAPAGHGGGEPGRRTAGSDQGGRGRQGARRAVGAAARRAAAPRGGVLPDALRWNSTLF
ncbi:hypothetical protein ACP4OV_007304 [Aristida adscensionis]